MLGNKWCFLSNKENISSGGKQAEESHKNKGMEDSGKKFQQKEIMERRQRKSKMDVQKGARNEKDWLITRKKNGSKFHARKQRLKGKKVNIL